MTSIVNAMVQVSNKEMEAKKRAGGLRKAALQDRVRVFSAARARVAKLAGG